MPRRAKCKDGCTYSRAMKQPYPRLCINCGEPEEPKADMKRAKRVGPIGQLPANAYAMPNESSRVDARDVYDTAENGGWTKTPIPDEFYWELEDLLARYGGVDCDGDWRLRAKIVDRSTHHAMHFEPIPYTHRDGVTSKDFEEALRWAAMNLSLAASDIDRLLASRRDHVLREEKANANAK